MSFALTEASLMSGLKDVTRRLGWLTLKKGDWLVAVRKAMGIPKGERAERLCMIHVRDVRRERLDLIDAVEVTREGFPDMTPRQFVEFFCDANGCKPSTEITRIEFCSTAAKHVHVLAHGHALCGKAGPPGMWPVDRWIGFEDPGAHYANCSRCAEALCAMQLRLARPIEEYRQP